MADYKEQIVAQLREKGVSGWWAEGVLSAPVEAGTARACRVHGQHRPHVGTVRAWWLRPLHTQFGAFDGRLLWVCPTGYDNVSRAFHDQRFLGHWNDFYSNTEKALALFSIKVWNTPLIDIPVTELEKLPWV